MSLKDRVGETTGPYREVVDPQRVEAFRDAIGSRYAGVAATFLTVFRKGEFELFQDLGIPLEKVLHAEQEYHYERALKSDMKIEFETKLASVAEKRGSKTSLTFVVVETSFWELSDREEREAAPFARSKTTVVVREGVA